MTRLTVTLLSNGHGEDSIGASLAREFRKQAPEVMLQAFPTVDEGNSYIGLDIPILGPRQRMPSSGLLMHNWELFQKDIRAGFLPMTFKQIKGLNQLKTNALVIIGDGFASLLSSFVRTKQRFYLQTLVSAYHSQSELEHNQGSPINRFFMENLSYPERALMRHLMKHVYVRDELTAMALHRQGVKHVSALGNPMLDQLLGQPMPEHVAPVIALLPGTRQYSSDALKVMIEALEHLPRATALVAWAGGPLPESVEGWQKERFDSRNGLVCRFVRPNSEIFVYEGRFEDVLATADIVLGTSGTANEQAAASGKPVISFPVPPLYSKAFLVNQKRLLSEALTICEPEVQAIALAIQHFLGDLVAYQKASKMGRRRMGKAGGSAAIVRDILERLEIP